MGVDAACEGVHEHFIWLIPHTTVLSRALYRPWGAVGAEKRGRSGPGCSVSDGRGLGRSGAGRDECGCGR
eukprot:3580299-Rhodomonas_salina.1